MKWFGSIPVRGVAGKNAIYQVTEILEKAHTMHVVLSPEGTISKVTKWNKGFYYMAWRANVPIVVGYINYRKKEIGVKGVIENLENVNTVIHQVNELYKDVAGKHPEKFSL